MRAGQHALLAAFACATILMLNGCGSSMSTNPTQPVPADVYVAGSDGTQAVYWKNGVETVLAQNATANAIAVSGTDVYVGGWVNSSGTPPYGGSVATIWKNGVATALTSSGFSQVNGLALANGNVYAVGVAFDAAKNAQLATVWTNGQPSYLTAGNYPNGSIPLGTTGDAIAVSGSDIYVAGSAVQCIPQSSNFNCGSFAAYWKDGSVTNLGTISVQNFGSWTSGIGVSGGDVYVSGVTGANPLQAVYWQNGMQVSLNLPQTAGSVSTAIAVAGNAVYVAGGNNGSIAGYWANGTFTTLGVSTNSQYSDTSGIALNGTDVYVAGAVITPQATKTTALYWKNGLAVELPSSASTARALAIAVAPQS